jgi:hypothetical protein
MAALGANLPTGTIRREENEKGEKTHVLCHGTSTCRKRMVMQPLRWFASASLRKVHKADSVRKAVLMGNSQRGFCKLHIPTELKGQCTRAYADGPLCHCCGFETSKGTTGSHNINAAATCTDCTSVLNEYNSNGESNKAVAHYLKALQGMFLGGPPPEHEVDFVVDGVKKPMDTVVEIQVTLSIKFYIVVEVDGPEHFKKAIYKVDLNDPLMVLYGIRVLDQDPNTRIIFARVPAGQLHSYVKLREWVLAMCLMAAHHDRAPSFTYMLIDIPEKTNAHNFPAGCKIATDAFPRDPEMSALRYQWQERCEDVITPHINKVMSDEDFANLCNIITDSKFYGTKADVYWGYAMQPMLAYNVTNNLRLAKADKKDTGGIVRTACNTPKQFRFPKMLCPIACDTPHGLTKTNLRAMVAGHRDPTAEEKVRRRFDVVEKLIADYDVMF